MIVKIHSRTNKALQGLINHYADSRKWSNRLKLKAYGVSQDFDIDKKLLTVSFKGLIKKILKKGGQLSGFKDQMKTDFLNELDKFMVDAGASKKDYEVVFSDEQ